MKRATLLLFLPVVSLAQKRDTVFRYLDEKLSLTSKEKALYYGVSVKRNDHWQLYAIYADTTPVISAYFKDKQLTIKDGDYILYYPGRKKAVEGMYINNQKNSLWRSWYENGQLRDSGAMLNNHLIREWKTWYENGQLHIQNEYKETAEEPKEVAVNLLTEEENPSVKDGLYQSWYPNGNKESAGNFENNAMVGEWQWFHENGKRSTKEIYKSGKLVSMQCYDSLGKEAGDFCSILKPATVIGIGNYQVYIEENLLWPEEAVQKKIEGVVKVNLTISKKGELEKLEIKSGQPVLQKAIADLFSKFQKWDPAVSHNRPVEWKDEFEIPFYRNRE